MAGLHNLAIVISLLDRAIIKRDQIKTAPTTKTDLQTGNEEDSDSDAADAVLVPIDENAAADGRTARGQ